MKKINKNKKIRFHKFLIYTSMIMLIITLNGIFMESLYLPFNSTISYADDLYTTEQVNRAMERANAGTKGDGDEEVLAWALNQGLIKTDSDGKYVQKRNNSGESVQESYGNLFARIIQANDDVKETADENEKNTDALVNILGDGGVYADIPYTLISTLGGEITNTGAGNSNSGVSSQGRLLASTLATFSHFNYIETVAGNKIASGASGFIAGLGRIVGGLLAALFLALFGVASWFNEQLSKFFIEFNYMEWFGFGSSPGESKNPISKAVTTFLDALGLNSTLMQSIVSLGLTILVISVVIYILYKLKGGVFARDTFNKPLKRLLIGFTLVFVFFPLAGKFGNDVDKVLDAAIKDNVVNPTIVDGYLLNTKNWAITTNMSPNALDGSGKVPSAMATRNYVDESYAPSKQRALISDMNKRGYAYTTSGKGEKTLSDTERNFLLLTDWMSNSTFSVNDYSAGIRGISNKANVAAFYEDGQQKRYFKSEEGKEFDNKNLEGYIWSAKQSPDTEERPVDGTGNATGTKGNKGEKAESVPVKYNASSNWGIKGKDSFSTQSVALILQTDFDSNGGHFYAYNLAPTGAQGMLKNVSTVKTTYRTVAMPGATGLGQMGSWLEMITTLAASTILFAMASIALLGGNLLEGTIKMFKSIGGSLVICNMALAMGAFSLFIAIKLTGVIALRLPPIMITFVTSMAGLLVDQVVEGSNGLHEIVGAGLVIAFTIFMIKPKQEGVLATSPIFTLVNLPIDIAKKFNEWTLMRVSPMYRYGRIANGLNNNRQNHRNNLQYDPSDKPKLENDRNNNLDDSNFEDDEKSNWDKKPHSMKMNPAIDNAEGNYSEREYEGFDKNIPNMQSVPEDDKNSIVDRFGNPISSDNIKMEDDYSNMNSDSQLSEEEINDLADSQTYEEFEKNLSGMDAGIKTALETDSAREMLEDSEFMTEDNQGDKHINYDSFEKSLQAEDEETRKTANNIFSAGASEMYNNMTENKQRTINKNKRNRTNSTMQKVSEQSKKGLGKTNDLIRSAATPGSFLDVGTKTVDTTAGVIDKGIVTPVKKISDLSRNKKASKENWNKRISQETRKKNKDYLKSISDKEK